MHLSRSNRRFLCLATITAASLAASAALAGKGEPRKVPGGGVAGAACPCFGDLNGDGTINAADLAVLLGAWNTSGASIPSDLDGSGNVNAADLSLLLGAWGPCPAAPINDNCVDAIPLAMGITEFCTYGANTDGPVVTGDCTIGSFNQVDHDIWYSWHAIGDGTLTVSTCGLTVWDTRIALYGSTLPNFGGCPGGLFSFMSLMTCSDDFCGFQSSVSVDVKAGHNYKVRVGGWLGHQGEGAFAASFQSAGSDCAHAILVPDAFSTTITGTTLDNDADGDYPNCALGDTYGEWITFESPCFINGSTMEVTTCNPGTDFDTVLSVYKIDPQNCFGPLYACNDDFSLAACDIDGLHRKSRVSFDLTPGWIYFVRVSGYQGARGNYEMSFSVYGCGN